MLPVLRPTAVILCALKSALMNVSPLGSRVTLNCAWNSPLSLIVFSAQEVTIVRLKGIFRPVEGVAGGFFCARTEDAPSGSSVSITRKNLDSTITILFIISSPRRSGHPPREEDAITKKANGEGGLLRGISEASSLYYFRPLWLTWLNRPHNTHVKLLFS